MVFKANNVFSVFVMLFVALFCFCDCNKNDGIEGLWITRSIKYIDPSVIEGIDTSMLNPVHKADVLSRYEYEGKSQLVFKIKSNTIESFRCNMTHYQLCVYNDEFIYSQEGRELKVNRKRSEEFKMSINGLSSNSLILSSEFMGVTSIFNLERFSPIKEKVSIDRVRSIISNNTMYYNNSPDSSMEFKPVEKHWFGDLFFTKGEPFENIDTLTWSLHPLDTDVFLTIDEDIHQIISLTETTIVMRNLSKPTHMKHLSLSSKCN